MAAAVFSAEYIQLSAAEAALALTMNYQHSPRFAFLGTPAIQPRLDWICANVLGAKPTKVANCGREGCMRHPSPERK